MDSVSAAVRAWYANAYWGPQNKDIGWADYILVDDGVLLAGRTVLNLGCYWPEDELVFGAHAARWVAIDFAPEVIDAARGLIEWPPRVEFHEGDMRALDFPAASFDVVLDFSSGDHLTEPDYRQAVREVHRVLRPAGLFVVVFTNRLAMAEYAPDVWTPETTEEWGRFGYSRGNSLDEMRALLGAAGFVIEREANTHLPRSGFLARRIGQPTGAGDGSGLA